MKDKQYLGDGVFAEFDGEYLMLTTEDGIRTTNRVSLEPEVLKNALRYFASIGLDAVQLLRDVLAEVSPS